MKKLFFYGLPTAVRIALIAIGVLLVGCSSSQEDGPGNGATKPNVVLIVIDDMGYNDLGVNGNADIHTPNLDKLATQGVRFTRHYVDSTCTPTRVGIMTGRTPASVGFRPDGRGISPELITLPEALGAAGYSNHHIGKWHVGHTSRLAWPLAQGFDTFFGFLNQFVLRGPHLDGELKYDRPTYRNPWLQVQDNPPQAYQGHLSELLTQSAVELINAKTEQDSPWFLNFWMYAPHHPIEPGEQFATQYSDTPQGRYRALIHQADDTVGRVIQALEENNLADNTLLIVASDNGGTNRQLDNNWPYFGTKATFREGGVRTPLIIRWPGHFPQGEVFDRIVTNFDYFPTIASAAGADMPDKLMGRDLLNVVERDLILEEPLFWEASNSQVHAWSVLSEHGRWRMSRYFVGPPELMDLGTNPSAEHNVLESHPDIGDELFGQYIAWRHKQRAVPVDYTVLGQSGKAKLTGMSFIRSPGFGGHTFAIEAIPSNESAPNTVDGLEESEMIAYQRNQWQLSQSGGRLRLEVNGLTLTATALVKGQCSSIIVTSYFGFSPLYPQKNHAQVQLYINGELRDSQERAQPELPQDDFLAPTYIGQDPAGLQRFSGILSQPRLLSERLVPAEEARDAIGNSIDSLAQEMCLP